MLAGMPLQTVCVIIAAYNGERTIARAVASALSEPEVREVIVVDDASSDESATRAADADDGSGRLKIFRHDANRGPSAARNLALRSGSADLVAVLDADDFIVPGRFARLLAVPDWDMIADNIAFVPEAALPAFDIGQLDDCAPGDWPMNFGDFIDGNIPEPNVSRGELGFLKPVIRREMLTRTGVAYDESLRLGEDFILYCQMLAAGARFRLIGQCGYVAVERPQSLSGRHRTADLAALAAAHEGLLRHPGVRGADRRSLLRHRAHVLRKLGHRDFLDRKQARGFGHAVRGYVARPKMLFGIACDIVHDKLFRRPGGASESGQIPRYLFR
ncbi:MAG: glycosyltransferase [Rhizorhabdus sp.]